MKEFILSQERLTALHEEAALGVCANRQGTDLDVDEINDWLEGHHLVSKKIAKQMGAMLEDNNEGVIVARHMLRYLHSISLEEYKAIRAYLNWEERLGGGESTPVSKDQDWYNACNMVREYMNIPSFAVCDQSVFRYFEQCNSHKDLMINRKAYWLHLAHPLLNRDDVYAKADTFVKSFYDLNVLIPAVEGHSASGTIIKSLVLMNPEIANMVEFNIFRIKKIE